MRFQELMPDVLHWLGITRIDRFASMSDMKYDALVRQGITIDERVPIPDELIPADARVEIEAKIAAGYFTGDAPAPRARPTRRTRARRVTAMTGAALAVARASGVRGTPSCGALRDARGGARALPHGSSLGRGRPLAAFHARREPARGTSPPTSPR